MQIFAPDGARLYIEGTNWTKGHFYALMGDLAFHIRALIHVATAEPGNCPRESFSLPLKGYIQGRLLPKNSKAQKVPLFSKSKCNNF